jgi:hypothetical protein
MGVPFLRLFSSFLVVSLDCNLLTAHCKLETDFAVLRFASCLFTAYFPYFMRFCCFKRLW